MLIRFINNNFFSKCRNSLCTTSILEALMDRDQVMAKITNMETLSTATIKIQEVQAMSFCLKVKRSSMLHQ